MNDPSPEPAMPLLGALSRLFDACVVAVIFTMFS